jgi:hypothetical protein
MTSRLRFLEPTRHSGISSIRFRSAAFRQNSGHGRLLHRGVDRNRLGSPGPTAAGP